MSSPANLIILLMLFIYACSSGSVVKRSISSLDENNELFKLEIANEKNIYNGNVAILNLVTTSLNSKDQIEAEVAFELQDKTIKTIFSKFYSTSPNTYQSIIAIPYKVMLKEHFIKILISKETEQFVIEKKILLKKFAYGKDSPLKVDPNTVNPDFKTIQKINSEQQVLNQIYSHSIEEKMWQIPFILPVKDPVITSAYGNSRVYNGELKSFHSGLDLRANEATNLYSSNSGIIVYMGDLHFTGNTVIIDHGLGLFTLYAHMSKFNENLSVGDQILKEQYIGKAGRTGRTTGPHLHWSLKIHGEFLNPKLLFSKELQ